VTIAIRPSFGGGMARDMEVIWLGCELKYFCKRGWTEAKSAEPVWNVVSGKLLPDWLKS